MNRTILFIIGVLICSCGYSQSVSPEVTASSGDHFTGTNAQLSWTIGEIMIDTYVTSSKQLTQGFHQSNITITNVEDLAENLQIKIFPNPTTDILTIDARDISDALGFSLYDASGKQLLSKKTINQSDFETIDLTDFTAGSYSLHLSNQDEKTIKTFIILKIK